MQVMSLRRCSVFLLPLVLVFAQPANAKPRNFAQADLDEDGYVDLAEFAGKAGGRAWKVAMANFIKRDADDDGLLSPSEFGGSAATGGGLYGHVAGVQEMLPTKWTEGINLIWSDGILSKAESRSFNLLLKKASRSQRAVLKSYWDKLRAAVLEDGPIGAIAEITSGWAQSDPAGAAAWIEALPGNSPERDALLAGIVSGWALQDPEAAAEWLDSVRPPRPGLEEGGGRPPR